MIRTNEVFLVFTTHLSCKKVLCLWYLDQLWYTNIICSQLHFDFLFQSSINLNWLIQHVAGTFSCCGEFSSAFYTDVVLSDHIAGCLYLFLVLLSWVILKFSLSSKELTQGWMLYCYRLVISWSASSPSQVSSPWRAWRLSAMCGLGRILYSRWTHTASCIANL